jgi:Caspase domain
MSPGAPQRRALIAPLLLSAFISAIAAAQGQTPGAAGVEPVTQAEISEIRQALQSIGMREADVVRGQDGRITLVGEYENRDAVETAFAAARAVVGLRRVAPTTPANIKYRLKGFDTAFASTVGKMMQKSAPPPETPIARPASPPETPIARPASPPEAPAARPAPPPPVVAYKRAPRTYGLVMGIGKFKYLSESHGLEFADKDAFDFYNFLVSPEGGGLPRDAIKLLRQEEATSVAVKTAMRDLLEQTQAGDTVVMFAASHGLPNAMNKFDIVLHDTEFPRHKAGTKESSLDFVITKRSTALADDDLQGWVAQMTLKDVRTVVVLDTCYSGKTFVSIPGYLPARTRSLSQHKKETEYSASMSQEAISDLASQAKDAKTTRIVIVSASENEESMESPKANGGLFTQIYLVALGKVHDYADAFDQAKPSVIRSARTVGHSQTPRLLAVPEAAVTKM